MSSVLDRILARKREEVAEGRRSSEGFGDLEPSDRDFRAALAAPGRRFILEVKKASPSRGAIRPDLVLEELLALYDLHADCVSVLTDEEFFGGSPGDLKEARRLCRRPLLRKDFMVDVWQIEESRHLGADAVLLIAAALGDGELRDFSARARELEMDVLFEVHDEEELRRVLDCGADLVGINNRNLVDLSIDLQTTSRLRSLLPDDVLCVSESGINERNDLQSLPADAFLIGSSILASEDLDRKIKELVYGPVKVCGITRRADAQAALDLGATWLGFLFHPPSPRSVTVEQAREICRALPGRKVGVFVDQNPDEILSIVHQCDLHGVQLHGNYDSEAVRYLETRLQGVFLVEVFSAESLGSFEESRADYQLLDAAPQGEGGLGESFDWARLQGRDLSTVFLAGGIHPANALEAQATGVYALDLSSGLESEPGIKDPTRLAALFDKLRAGQEESS
ncbi:MAG: bifunctional indole-3-glycerol-phosphate synthase TrpC/phosphoribosylanthranilate isomerase TrpF [Candidatus Krumholzibacteria bacterium]|nr:bifunctional indole-3-glycerol-phosphate synthase TrpC/phosphoribosylanthranilate isomerase TrpF [Candidatus Krumholzibacteria bacterium]